MGTVPVLSLVVLAVPGVHGKRPGPVRMIIVRARSTGRPGDKLLSPECPQKCHTVAAYS